VEYATVIRTITDYNKVVCTFRINLCFIRILDVNHFFLEINVRENRRGITNGQFRHWQHWVHKTQDKQRKTKTNGTQHKNLKRWTIQQTSRRSRRISKFLPLIRKSYVYCRSTIYVHCWQVKHLFPGVLETGRKSIPTIYYIVLILQMSCMQKILHLETYSEWVATAPFMLGHGLLCFALHKM
jgi:hypothetical protein